MPYFGERRLRRLWENHFGIAKLQWPILLGRKTNISHRMIKKTVQQGRSKQRGEAYASVR